MFSKYIQSPPFEIRSIPEDEEQLQIPREEHDMTTEATRELDMEKAQALAFQMVGDVASTLMSTLTVIGDRLELFDALRAVEPATSEAFAVRAGIDERYAREWLSAMACHGYVTYDDESKQFFLTPEQAFCLVNRDSPLYLTSFFAETPDLWKNIDLLTESFQHGGGVPQGQFGHEFWCGFERFTRTDFLNNMCQDWIPAMPEVDARLRAGGSVADVGCGNGQALIHLARCYPEATLVGFDAHPPAIEAANSNATKAGLSDRIRFEVRDVTQGIPGSYDLITAFDVVHDLPWPGETLREIHKALKPGGTCFVQEFNLSGDLQENIDHPLGIGALGYAISTNYCMTQSLAVDGEGIGTCMGEAKMRELAADAGFGHVRRLDFEQNPFNVFYEIRA